MKRPAQEKIDEYLGCDMFCPWCGAEGINPDPIVETDVTIAWRNISCLSCGAEWQDEYRLVAISWIDQGERYYSDETEEE